MKSNLYLRKRIPAQLVILVFLSALTIPLITMGQTEKKNPQNVAQGSGILWTAPGNAKTSNNFYATCTFSSTGQSSAQLTATAFGFQIPAEATIQGIRVRVERHSSPAGQSVRDQLVRLVLPGGTLSDNLASTGTDWPAADDSAFYGGASHLWGMGTQLTPAAVNSSDFGVQFTCGSFSSGQSFALVDEFLVTVYYSTTPAPVPGIAISSDGSGPDPSAILELKSSNQGFLLPRTAPASIANPVAGLFVYDNTSLTPSFHNGTKWVQLGKGNIEGSGSSGYVTFWNGEYSISGENGLFWDASNNRLGIGTDAPAQVLDLNCNVAAGYSGIRVLNEGGAAQVLVSGKTGNVNTNASVSLQDATSSVSWMLENRSNSGNQFWLESYDGTTWRAPLKIFKDAPTNSLYIGATSCVGLGTTNATAALTIGRYTNRWILVDRATGANETGGGLVVQAGSSVAGGQNLLGGSLALKSGISTGNQGSSITFSTPTPGVSGTQDNPLTEKARITASGDVGIGISNPGARLDVNGQVKISGGTPAAGQVLTSDANGLATWEPPVIGEASGKAGSVSIWETDTKIGYSNNLSWDNFLEVLGIGTSSPDSKLKISGNVLTNLGFQILGTGTETNYTSLYLDNVSSTMQDTRFISGESAAKWRQNFTGGIRYITGWHATLLNTSNQILAAGTLATVNSILNGSNVEVQLFGMKAAVESATPQQTPSLSAAVWASNNRTTATDYIFYGVGAAEKSYFQGKVGIGVTNPTRTLEVDGTSRLGQYGNTINFVYKTSSTQNVPSIPAGSTVFQEVAVGFQSGAYSDWAVSVSPDADLPDGVIIAYARYAYNGVGSVVRIAFTNTSATAKDPVSMEYHISIVK